MFNRDRLNHYIVKRFVGRGGVNRLNLVHYLAAGFVNDISEDGVLSI
jgi:hypothetical protein